MTEENKTQQTESQDQQIDQLEDLTALKSAYERQKNSNSELKQTNAQLAEQNKQMAKLLEQVQQGLSQGQGQNNQPVAQPQGQTPTQQLIEQFNYQQQIQALTAKAAADAKAEAEKQFLDHQQALQRQLEQAKAQTTEEAKNMAIFRAFSNGYGKASEYESFRALYSKHFQFDPASGEISKVVDANGNPLYFDSNLDKAVMPEGAEGMPITPAAFMWRARNGKAGDVAQACFEPLSSSQGTGSRSSGVVLPDGNQRMTREQFNEALKDPKQSAALMKAFGEGKVPIVD